PTPSYTPSSTPTPDDSDFPTTAVLDNFNRANGSVGGNWNILAGSPAISGSQLDFLSNSEAAMLWKTAYGANQEAYVTLPTLDPASTEIDLLLKAQNSSDWTDGVMEVWYDPSAQIARVETYAN